MRMTLIERRYRLKDADENDVDGATLSPQGH